jgi:hypothetical protein
MTAQSPERHRSLSPFLILGVGWVLSILWWVLALLSGGAGQEAFPQSLLAALGGFVPALVGLLVMQAARGRVRKKPTRAAGWTWVVAGLVALYPLLVVALLVWEFFQPLSAGLMRVLTHPAMLVFNLMAVLLIGPVADLTGLKEQTVRSLKQRLPKRAGKPILLVNWWLWHLPFIFVNGSVLARLHFSNGILALYLVTVLGVSYLFTWGYDRKRRRVVVASWRHQEEERG